MLENGEDMSSHVSVLEELKDKLGLLTLGMFHDNDLSSVSAHCISIPMQVYV